MKIRTFQPVKINGGVLLAGVHDLNIGKDWFLDALINDGVVEVIEEEKIIEDEAINDGVVEAKKAKAK